MGDHYETLGLQRDASKADIKNAYFRLAHRYHPDHHSHADAAAHEEAARRFRQAKDAYDVLSDYHSRADYDRNLRRSSSSSSSSSSGYKTSSSKQGYREGYRSGPRPPRPRGGSKFQNVLVGALLVLEAVAELAKAWETMQRDVEAMKRQIKLRKRQWENQEWKKKNPWKSWMESREKEKKKNWWTGIFRS